MAEVRGWQISTMQKSRSITRLIQPIGIGSREYRWRYGFLMRLPHDRMLLVNRDPRRLRRFATGTDGTAPASPDA